MRILFSCLLTLVILSGCGAYENYVGYMNREFPASDVSSFLSTIPAVEPVELDADKESFSDSFYYKQLNEEHQAIYNEVYDAFLNMKKEIAAQDREQVMEIVMCVKYDHPEIFWVNDEVLCFERPDADTADKIIRFQYRFDKKEIADYKERVNLFTQDCIAGFPPDADDREKCQYVYDYVIEQTEYNLGAQMHQDIISLMLYGESVCAGYAKTVQHILNTAGIPTITALGYVGTEAHGWNIVQLDEHYYHIDATWGDGLGDLFEEIIYELENDEELRLMIEELEASEEYEAYLQQLEESGEYEAAMEEMETALEDMRKGRYYFLASDDDIFLTHTYMEGYTYPVCA